MPTIDSSFFQRHGRKILWIQLVLAPFTLWAAARAYSVASNRGDDWLPEAFEETQELNWFKSHFVADDLLAISWQGAKIDDPHCRQLAELLRKPIEVPDGTVHQLTRHVVVADEAVEQLTGEPLQLSRPVAVKRLEGWLANPETENAMILVFVTYKGWQEREFLLDFVVQQVESLTGLPPEQIHVAGATVDTIAIDRASRRYMNLMLAASYVLSFVIMYGVFRNFQLMLIVFLDSYFCQQVSLTLIYLSGTEMDTVMLIVPTLVYVLAVSTGVHLVSYYRDALASVPADQAGRVALGHGLVPCVLSTITTAVGLVSLMISVLVPVDNFAFFSALGVLASTATLLLTVPSKLERISGYANAAERFGRSRQPRRSWDHLQSGVDLLKLPIILLTVVALAFCVMGVSQLRSSARIFDFFNPGEKVIQDYQWFEETIGPLVPVEIVLRLPKSVSEETLSMADRMRYVAATHGLIAKEEGIGAVVSAASFAPQMQRRQHGASAVAEERVLNDQLNKHRERYVELAMLRETEDEQLWRISARSYASRPVDYQLVLERLRVDLNHVLEKFQSQTGEKAEVVVCGGVPLSQKTQRQMLIDLKEGFLMAAGLITVVMIALAISTSLDQLRQLPNLRAKTALLLRRTGAGCVAMIPNVLPCLGMFGAMGWAGVAMDIGSLLTASVALGIAVDDTLHFVNWFYRALADGASRREAVRHAYEHCGPAMIRTTLICGLGLLVYVFSPFVPIARFSWLMFAMLSAALVGDLVVLPALLLSKLGKLFEPELPADGRG